MRPGIRCAAMREEGSDLRPPPARPAFIQRSDLTALRQADSPSQTEDVDDADERTGAVL